MLNYFTPSLINPHPITNTAAAYISKVQYPLNANNIANATDSLTSIFPILNKVFFNFIVSLTKNSESFHNLNVVVRFPLNYEVKNENRG